MGSHGVYHCQWCLSVRDREKYIETGDQTFLNVILHHVRDDSGFSRPNVGRYLNVKKMSESWNGLRPIVGNLHAIFEVIWLNRFRVMVSDTCMQMTHPQLEIGHHLENGSNPFIFYPVIYVKLGNQKMGRFESRV